MDPWIWWTALAVGLGLLELLTLDLTLLMLAGGAAAAAGASALGAPLWASALVAAGTSVALLGVVRPLALRHRRQPPEIRTGSAALVGSIAVAATEVTRDGGLITLAGEQWSARSYSDAVIETGQHVQVISIDGATAVVVPE